MSSAGRNARVVLFLSFPILGAGALLSWKALSNCTPSHALCVEQAERRLERGLGEGLAREATNHPQDYERLRDSMIRACAGYWTKAYAECMRDKGGLGLTDECEKLGRVRDR